MQPSRAVVLTALSLAPTVLAWSLPVQSRQSSRWGRRAVAMSPYAAMAIDDPAAADGPLSDDPTAVGLATGDVFASPTFRAAGERHRISQLGLFAPLVVGAKSAMGTKELNALRAEVILKHSKVIMAFVDTSESDFGQLALRRLFEAADKDGDGQLSKEEVREALHALGFSFLKDKQVDGIVARADVDEDDFIDFEEFARETPVVLRRNLVKLAKQNGHELGFLA